MTREALQTRKKVTENRGNKRASERSVKEEVFSGLQHRYAKPVERFIRFFFSARCCAFVRWNWPPFTAAPWFSRCLLCHTQPQKKEIITIEKDISYARVKVAIWTTCYKRLYTKINACQWMKNHCKPKKLFRSFAVDLLAQLVTQTLSCIDRNYYEHLERTWRLSRSFISSCFNCKFISCCCVHSSPSMTIRRTQTIAS